MAEPEPAICDFCRCYITEPIRTVLRSIRWWVVRERNPSMLAGLRFPDNDHHITGRHPPSSVSPHTIRRGSITYSLNKEMPDKVVSDRANVRPEVIEQHYDRRPEREKMEQRRDYLDDL